MEKLIGIILIVLFFIIVYKLNKPKRLGFGKYKGYLWKNVPDEYLLWLRFNSTNPTYRGKAQAEYFRRNNLNSKNETERLYVTVAELEKKLPKVLTQEDKDGMKKAGDEFERYVGQCYENEGYKVEYRGLKLGLEDGGIDLIARKGNETLLIQCKYWKKEKSITQSLVKEFYGSCNFYIDQRSLDKSYITCVYAVANKYSISYGAYQLFKDNYVNCRFRVVE
jgi:Holliday junction resolvase-like predicted endonuclease